MYELLKFVHIIGATILLGTGIGIAFFMVMAHRTGDAKTIYETARIVVVADFVFTASAVIVQPITGVLLALQMGWPILEGWVLASLLLYVFTGAFWLPVVWIQLRLRDLAQQATTSRSALPERYYQLYRIWFACGFPAFAAVLTIFWLMITKPELPF